MITPDDWLQMQSDLEAVRDDHSASITIRRGTLTLTAQTVRIARSGSGRRMGQSTVGPAEGRAGIVVMGNTELNIQVDDRFTYGDLLYRVTFVRPNRSAAVTAEAEAEE